MTGNRRKPMTPAARKRVSEAMTKKWAERRATQPEMNGIGGTGGSVIEEAISRATTIKRVSPEESLTRLLVYLDVLGELGFLPIEDQVLFKLINNAKESLQS